MTRAEFIKLCGIVGIGMPVLASCSPTKALAGSSGVNKVIVIGAGAAGMTAAYLLTQQGIEVQVLEASTRVGGRIKEVTTFADFPIPVGAEWLHVEKDVLGEIVNDPSVSIEVPTTPYDLEKDPALMDGEPATLKDLGFSVDQKFIGTTWLGFFKQYLLPSIREKIQFEQVVNAVDYSGKAWRCGQKAEEFSKRTRSSSQFR